MPHQVRRITNGVRRRGAAGRDDVAPTAQAECHRHLARKRTDRRCGNGINADLFDSIFVIAAILLFSKNLAATTGTHQNTDAPQLLNRQRRGVDAGILQRFAGRGPRQRDGP